MKFLLPLLLAASAFAQTAAFPGSLATNQNLLVAVDNIQTTLISPMASADSVAVVASSTGWQADMIATVDLEQMLVTGVSGNVLSVTRGFAGTTAAAHLLSAPVSAFIDAYFHNAMRVEVQAIESTLGTNLSNIHLLNLNASSFVFSASPAGTLSAGNNLITLAPVPAGVNWNDAPGGANTHYIWVAGTGTPEACTILTAGPGTAVGGAPSGTLTLTCANAHSAGYTLSSASSGIVEAAIAGGLANVTVYVAGSVPFKAPIVLAGSQIAIDGQGSAVIVNQSISTDGVTFTGCYRCQLIGLTIDSATCSLISGVTTSATSWTMTCPVPAPATPFSSYVDDSEVVSVTNISGSTWTVTRQLLGTPPTAHSSGALATISSGGAGVDFLSGVNTTFFSSNLRVLHAYRGIFMQVAPTTSYWVNTHVESSNFRGIDSPANNDEKFVNLYSIYSVGDGLRVGPGTGNAGNCAGSFDVSNAVFYDNRGDNIHVEGTSVGAPCVFADFSNVVVDSAYLNGLYSKNAAPLIVTGITGGNNVQNSIYLDANTLGTLSNVNTGGAGKDGIYITDSGGTATAIGLSNVSTLNNGTASPGTYYGLHITGAASHVNVSGLQTGNLFTSNQAGGIKIDSTGGAPTDIAITGTQFPGLVAATYIARAASLPVVGPSAVSIQANFNSSVNCSASCYAQAIANMSWTSVTFDTNVFDTGGAGACTSSSTVTCIHSTTANQTQFQVPAGGDGLYQFTCQDSFATSSAGFRYGRIFKNGTTSIAVADLGPITSDITYFQVSTYAQLAGGDYLECQVDQTSGGSLNMGGIAAATLAKVW